MRAAILLWIVASSAFAATFGSPVAVVGGATDLVLDEARSRIYVVNSTQQRIDVFNSGAQPRLQRSIPVGLQPISAALARDGHFLYVTSFGGSSLDVVDLDANAVVRKVSLPAAPEGVAVGGDGRVLITTVGSGTNNADNRLLLFNPNLESGDPLIVVPTTLPAPASPQIPAPSSRVFMSTRSNLSASADGRWIIGLNNPTTNSRQVFVFEVASGTVLRSRTLTSISNVLSVAPDGSKFMAGLSLFDTETLAILAQQNTANSMHPFANNANFNTQQNQGGSTFASDGSRIYSAFNVAPVNATSAQANITQLLLSDPDNLFIQLALQLPENLTGNMVISTAGDFIYALSQSGFLVVPIGRMNESPIAVLDQTVAVLINDQCGVTRDASRVEIRVRNAGRGTMNATASVLQSGTTFTFPLGGQVGGGGVTTPIGGGGPGGGAGGGAVGGGFPILLPPGTGGGGTIQIPPGTVPGTGNTTTTTQQNAIAQTAPTIRTRRDGADIIFELTFSSRAATSLGTSTPVDLLVTSNEAINLPSRIRVYQNNRNAEARGNVVGSPVSISTGEALVDLVLDTARRRLYIANSGMNRVEVFDTATQTFLAPIKVGQLPRSLAITPNGKLLYVANTGGESISIVDLDEGVVTGRVKFPPVPYNASFALNTPSLLAATVAGVQIVMSDGSLWKIVDDEALPRRTSPVIGSTTVQAPRTIVATPEGEYALLLGGTGTAYLYDAMSDDYVLSQSVVTTPIQGYFGPLAAGPRGQYFLVNGRLLNSTLTPIATTGVSTVSTRPVAAVTAVSATLAARYLPPALANANSTTREVPVVELVDAATGQSRALSAALEGPLATQVGTQRVNTNGRTMAVDATNNLAYVLTISGLSIVPLTAVATGPGPGGGPGGGQATSTAIAVRQGGLQNLASKTTTVAPGTLVSIFGTNLATDGSVNTPPYPTRMGGVCVTVDESPIPLVMTSTGQINAQLPPDLRTGSHSLVVRAVDRNLASSTYTFTAAKYAPAVLVNESTGQAAVFRSDGTPITNRNKADRDEKLYLFAVGLGATKGAAVTAGQASPPGALTDSVAVYFGDSRMAQSEMIVESSALEPGLVGIYRIDIRVPGFRTRGESLPVMVSIGGVNSPVTGSVVPTTAVN